MSISLQTRTVPAGDHDIWVTEAGDPTYLFLHGWPESSYGWRPLVELAGRTAHAVALDLPGIGGSGPDRDAGMTDVRSVVIPDAGHFLHNEAPEALWSELQRFRHSL